MAPNNKIQLLLSFALHLRLRLRLLRSGLLIYYIESHVTFV